ncbi:ATP-binding protein [Myxococcota bacterium]|nr:ATP-binding protein [Myxococcota bacterium]
MSEITSGSQALPGPPRAARTAAGHGAKVRAVLDAFERARLGATEVVALSGWPGADGSALVEDAARAVEAAGGRAARGGGDPDARGPLAPAVEAARALCRGILAGGGPRLGVLRASIRRALGPDAGVLAAEIPEMERLAGPTSPPPLLDPAAEEDRLDRALISLFGAASVFDRPVVLFLDGLGWEDRGTLRLLRGLAADPSLRRLLLVGRFRCGGPRAAPPDCVLHALEAAGGRILTLPDPSPEDTAALPDAAAPGDEAGRVRPRTVPADPERRIVALEDEVLRVRAELDHALAGRAGEARRLEDLLALLGHELRNPLSGISNALHVLERVGATDDVAVSHRRVIGRQVRHLARLVDDLLDVARLQTRRVELRLRPLDLREIASRCVESHHPHAVARGQTLRLAISRQSAVADGDPVRLEQVVGNLVDNAIRYAGPGASITASAEREGAWAVIRVQDDGRGIPAELLPRIFDSFVRGASAGTGAAGGLGLGLTLVRDLVDLHGGVAEALSDGPGRGSEFVVRLPARDVDAAPLGDGPEPPSMSPHSVLIVEDGADTRETLRELLRLFGHVVHVAATGREGVEAALAIRPEVAVVDIDLPEWNGYEVARRIRAALGDAVVLVALTGYGQPDDRYRALEAGFDEHLVKPVDLDVLMASFSARRFNRLPRPS